MWTTQLAKYAHVLYVKPSNKAYVLQADRLDIIFHDEQI